MFGRLCLATFLKVELNCKLKDVGSVVVLSLQDSPASDLHNHLVYWLLLFGVVCMFLCVCVFMCPSLRPNELPWLIL